MELYLEARHIYKAYGDRVLLDIDSLSIHERDRIGLIGENGAGKSTLLSILAGEARPDSGEVRRSCSFSVIHQMGGTEYDLSARDQAEFRAPEDRAHLSGGEQTRRRIAGALSGQVSLLFADEPTTDLDLEGIRQLKKRLAAHRGALVLISHDRGLLNELCTTIWQLEDGHITEFSGNYDAWQEEQKRRRDFQQFEYEQYRQEEARLKESAQRLYEMSQQVKKAPARMGNSEARLHKRDATDAILRLSHARNVTNHRIEHLEKKEKPRSLPQIHMTMGSHIPVGARNALTGSRINLRAGGKTLLKNGEFSLLTGSKTALMGPNGCGKTTLLRSICSPEDLPEGVEMHGNLRRNPAVKLGWFDQNHEQTLDLEKSALENAMATAVEEEATVRTTFARLNLRGDDVFKPVGALSGGERAKTALVRLLVSDCNVLVLDEPTNHLDVFTLEELEQLLKAYQGTILLVSHDRTFVNAVADRLILVENSTLRTYEGTLEQMEENSRKDGAKEAIQLEITTLQMRMAALSLRMSAPKKGDSPDRLNAEYEALMLELRDKKKLLE